MSGNIKELERVKAPANGEPEWHPQFGTKPKKPSMWHVVLLNDDYTPMDFVVAVLVQFFHKGPEEATAIMLEVHKKGKGIAGTFTHEVTEQKCKDVEDCARFNEYPLKAVPEKAD